MSSTKKYRAKRLSRGEYLYRGFKVTCLGYYNPDHHVVWEATDEHGCGFGQGYSLAEVKMWIDEELKEK